MNLRDILQAIKEERGKSYFVGGCVRDAVLKIPAKDKDVEVHSLPIESLQKVLERFGPVDLIGKNFGVLKLHSLPDVDFSVPRLDNKIGKSHKDFTVAPNPYLTPREAARRRDLTMNSMLMDAFTNEISDPFGGLNDIKLGLMKATDPSTFVEDDLRSVRVAQFVSRFPFLRPDAELVKLCSQADLSNLPGERLWGEFRKMFLKGSRPDLGLAFLEEAGLLRFFPEVHALAGCQQHPVYHAEGDVLVHTKMVLAVAATLRSGNEQEDLTLMTAALCHDFGKALTTFWSEEKKRLVSNNHDEAGVAPTKDFLRRLRAPEWLIDDVCVLVKEHLKPFELIKHNSGQSAYRRLSRRMKGVPLELLVKLATADGEGRICYDAAKQTREDLTEFLKRANDSGVATQVGPVKDIVTGKHLLARGLKPSKIIGTILAECREYSDDTGEQDPEKILDVILPRFTYSRGNKSTEIV